MTWLRTVIFSVAVAVVTGVIMLIPDIEENAIHEIGVGYEMWIVFAVFIV